MTTGFLKLTDMTERQMLRKWGRDVGDEPYPKTAFNKGFWLAWKKIKGYARKAKTIQEFWTLAEDAQNDLQTHRQKKHLIKFEGRYLYSAGYMDGLKNAILAFEKQIQERTER